MGCIILCGLGAALCKYSRISAAPLLLFIVASFAYACCVLDFSAFMVVFFPGLFLGELYILTNYKQTEIFITGPDGVVREIKNVYVGK